MDMIFYNRIAKSNAGTNSRTRIRDFVLHNPEHLKELVDLATDLDNKNHYKAIWIIEMLAETNPKMLASFADIICDTISKYKHESAIRGISRTAFFLSTSKAISLTETQEEKLIAISLDWLIGDAKVAPKAYAMYILCHYAKNQQWIKEELKNIINKDFANHSAGYKAAAREVLKKINN
jgi:hypothetical protein